jgi:hypothetical protein
MTTPQHRTYNGNPKRVKIDFHQHFFNAPASILRARDIPLPAPTASVPVGASE